MLGNLHKGFTRTVAGGLVLATMTLTFVACSGAAPGTTQSNPRMTSRDRTVKGAGIGAGIGVVGALLAGKKEADELLVGAAIGALIGGGVGAYMDAQQEKLARIPGTTVERVDKQTLLVHFDSDLLFATDSSSLSDTSRSSLDEVGGVLGEYPKTAVVVQGHTDSTGSPEHNQDLSERRARSVASYLTASGVASERLSTLGHGEEAPVASNDTESGRAQHRRVDVMLRAKAR